MHVYRFWKIISYYVTFDFFIILLFLRDGTKVGGGGASIRLPINVLHTFQSNLLDIDTCIWV